MQRCMRSLFRQALSLCCCCVDTIWILSTFTGAKPATQALLAGGSCSIPAASSCLMSKGREANKALEAAISTVKSLPTGQVAAAKGRIQADKDDDNREETPGIRERGVSQTHPVPSLI